jgi:hypothetical protein
LFRARSLASKEGVSLTALMEKFFLSYQSTQDSLKSADESYADYQKTGETISLEQLIKNNDLDR